MITALRNRISNRPIFAKTVSNMGWLAADKLLRMGVGLFVGVWVARYLGPVLFGQLSFSLSLIAIFGALAGMGMNGIIVRNIVQDQHSASTTLVTAFTIRVASGATAILLALLAVTLLEPSNDTTRSLTAILSIILLTRATEIAKFWFESQVQARYSVWIENSAFVLSASTKIVLILSDASIYAFAITLVGEAILVGAGLIVIYRIKSGHRAASRPSLSIANTLLRQSWPLMLAGMAVMLYAKVDLIMLQKIRGEHEVGIYAAAARISEIWYFIPIVIVSSLSPFLIKLHSSSYATYLENLKKLYATMTWMAIAISLPLAFLATPIVAILFGPDFDAAAPVLVIHIWASVAVFIGVASSQYLLIENLQKISLCRTLIGLTTNILLNLILIPTNGANGAAIATLVSYFASTYSLACFRATREHSKLLFTSPFTIVWPKR